uniref:Uncharacterized protein n=2 Tax=Schistocephalus solidus TaxID=70667 RepID=A0A0V0J3V3_SCHSO
MQCLKESDQLSECPTILKVPSVFVIIGSIVFTLQIIGISLMRRYKEEFCDVDFYSTEDKNNAEKYFKSEVTPLTMLRIPAFYVLWSYQFIMCFLTFFAVSSYKVGALFSLAIFDHVEVSIIKKSDILIHSTIYENFFLAKYFTAVKNTEKLLLLFSSQIPPTTSEHLHNGKLLSCCYHHTRIDRY